MLSFTAAQRAETIMKQPFFRRSLPLLVLLFLWAADARPQAGIDVGGGTGVTGPTARTPTPATAAPVPAGEPSADGPAKPKELTLQTSDGAALHAWYYPALLEKDGSLAATVILLHGLDGSHRSVEPLALALQAAGCGVVAPDLRGHGASTSRTPSGRIDGRALKKMDFELMAASRGGQIRDQSSIRGDVETVRNWIAEMDEQGDLELDRLFVVGSGLGAALATAWTAEDANWPSRTSGAQGRQVRGLVLVSPAWATRGFSINAPLAHEVIKAEVPILVVAGRNDEDAVRVFDQLRRQRERADGWFKQLADGTKDKPAKLEDPSKASLFFFEFDSTRTGDALASDRTLNPAAVITKFLTMALDRPRR